MKDLSTKAKEFAIQCHTQTNHTYDGKPYQTHLQMVVDYVMKYSFLLDPTDVDTVVASAWTHDTIEDCRKTYNDVRNVLGLDVAEITYALTNEKGRNRSERANDKYYEGIRTTPLAGYVKLCDRLANVKYSSMMGSKMIGAYKKEHDHFKKELESVGYSQMWDELQELLSV